MPVPRSGPSRDQISPLNISILAHEIVPGSTIVIEHTLPDGEQLQIELAIPRRDLDRFRPGNTLRIRQAGVKIYLTILDEAEDDYQGSRNPNASSYSPPSRGGPPPGRSRAPLTTRQGGFFDALRGQAPSRRNQRAYNELLLQTVREPNIEALIDNAINDSFVAGPAPRRQPQPTSQARPARQPTRQRVAGDCAICLGSLSEGTETTWCERGCGQNIHTQCLLPWIGTAWMQGTEPTCPNCRAVWWR